MNEEDTLGPSVVNDHQQPSETLKCLKRNFIKFRRQRSPIPQTQTSMPTPLQVDTNESNNKHETKAKHLLEIKQNVSPEKIIMPASAVCNMCCRKDDVCVNLQHNHATVLTVSDITRLPSWDIRQILSSVCSRCLVYISAITESSTKLRTRCEQAMYSHSSSLAPPTPDTSPNNFLQVTTTLPDDVTDQSNNEHNNGYALDYCNQLPNSNSPPPPAILANITYDAMRSRSPTPSNAGQNSMLKIHYEQPVSPLNTESGGGGVGGKNNKRSYQRVQVIPVQMLCSNCNRAYWRKDYYRKHVRRCSAKYRYAKSVIPNRSRSSCRLELDAVSVVSETNERITTNHNQPRIFRCNICTVTVDNICKLRQHKRIHMTRYYCDICSNEFTSQNEYDFHRVQCMAKMEVFEKGLENIRNDVISPLITPARRRTRSYSRAVSLAPTVETSKADDTEKNIRTRAKRTKSSDTRGDKVKSAKQNTKSQKVLQKEDGKKSKKAEPVLQKDNVKRVRKSRKTQTILQKDDSITSKNPIKSKLNSIKDNLRKSKLAVQEKSNTQKNKAKRSKISAENEPTFKQNDDLNSTITNYVKRHKNLYTTVAKTTSIKILSQTNDINIENEAEEEDYEDDDVSETDTLYSKRLSLTNHWVEEHSISSHSHLSLGDNYIDEYMEDIPFRSLKEYDLYLLDRLKIEVKLHTLTCFVQHCKFNCATLNEMMVHDYIYHFKRPWYYCHKCGYRFTSKVFLDYHLDLQNKGRYVCYKCGGHFEYQNQLDRHLIQHNRMSMAGGEKYICHYCNFKFLDEDKLIKHCHDENHECNKKRKLIEIDHTMTITNKLPHNNNKQQQQQNNKNEYQVKILNMILKIMPSKRCTPIEKYRSHLPPYQRIPNRIGQVEFRHPSNPNCVGCL